MYDLFQTAMQHRLIEIEYSSWLFWEVSIFGMIICLLPIYFYVKTQALFFPKLKDLIIQNKISYESVMREADPRRIK